jgi:hypothetical protein
VADVEATATRIALIGGGRLIRDAAPEELLRDTSGRVWEALIPAAELTAFRERHRVSGTLRRSDGVQVRVVSATSPWEGARQVAPTLEDAYLWFMAGAAVPSSAVAQPAAPV